MAVRDFDGSNDSIVLDNGAIGAFNEAGDSHTIVAILKPALTANPQAAFSIRAGVTSDNMASLYFADDGTTHNGTDDPSGVSYTGSGFVDTSWQIVAVSKGAGTVAARFHRKVLGSGSWSHTDGTGTIGTTTSVASECRIGEFSNAGGDYDGLVAVVAFYATVLSDAQVESIQTTPSTQTLLDLGAVGLWEFNQASTALSVVDRTGSGADQTAITGTTVVTGDDPPGWTFAEELADSVDFPSGTDLVQWTAGNIAANGALTMVAICKPTGITLDANYHWLFTFNLLANGAFGIHNAQLKVYDGGTERNSAFSIPALNEWYLIAVTKATGTVTPNFHLYRYSTDAWTHSAGSGTIGNLTTPTGFQAITFPYASGEAFDGNVLIAGVWDSELSDGAIEGLITGTQAWRDAAPDEAWRFDSGSTTSPLTGVSWQTNFPSGDLDVGDAPAGWSDAVTGLQHLGTCGVAMAGSSGNTLTCPAARNIAAGEQLIVALACHNLFATDDEPIVSISDGTANSYSRLYSVEMLNLYDIWFCTTVADVPAGTNIIITLAATQPQFRLCRIDAYQGLAASPLDQSASQHLTSTAVIDSGFTATTTQADELIYGFMACDGSTYIIPAADLRIRQFEFSGMNCVSSDRIVTSTGTYKANGTLQSTIGNAEATVLTLKAAEEGYPAGSAAWVTTL